MKGKVILVLLVGIIILIAGSAYLLTRNNLGNNNQKAEEVTPEKVATINTEIPDFDKGRVRLESELSRYDFVVNSPKKLVDLLYSWGLYDRKYDLKEFGKNEGGVDEIVFVLTREPIKEGYIGMSRYWGQSSAGVYAGKNTLTVKIYFVDAAFPQIKGYITKQALYGLYLVSHPMLPSEKILDIEDKVSNLIDEIEKEGLLFNIAKKPE